MPTEPPSRTYVAWNGATYPWPPPDGWYLATDGRWWAPAADGDDGAVLPDPIESSEELEPIDGGGPAPDPPSPDPGPDAGATPHEVDPPTPAADDAQDTSDRDDAMAEPVEAMPEPPAFRRRRWPQRLALVLMLGFVAGAITWGVLAATGRLDGDPEPVTATSLPARPIDAAPVFRDVDPPVSVRSARSGTAEDPHRPGELFTLGDDSPASAAFEVVLEGVRNVDTAAFDAIGADERCVAIVVELRSELGPPDTAVVRLPRLDIVVDGVAVPPTATCGDPEALATEFDATWIIDAEPDATWQRVVDFAVVPTGGGAPAVAVEGQLVAAAPLVVDVDDEDRLADASARRIEVLSVEPDGSGCVLVYGTVEVPYPGQGVVDADVAEALTLETADGDPVAASTCGSPRTGQRAELLRLAGGATATWYRSFEVDPGAGAVLLLDGVPVDEPA